jgi:hypothetical protein
LAGGMNVKYAWPDNEVSRVPYFVYEDVAPRSSLC